MTFICLLSDSLFKCDRQVYQVSFYLKNNSANQINGCDMIEDTVAIKFWYAFKKRKADTLRCEANRIFPTNKWIAHLILSLIFIVLAYFSTFLLKSDQAKSSEGEYVVIKETHNVEAKTYKGSDK